MRLVGLDHVVLRARDPERLRAFYCDVLGCTVERRLSPELGLVQLRAGAALIDIVAVDSELGRRGGAAPGDGGGNMDHFCLRVDVLEVEALRSSLRMAGFPAETDPPVRRYGAEGFGPSLYLRDPEGNIVELKGPPDDERGS
jgi:catechol 2,3-dioxygenase-like lactoylglutathione lyase family enzyme